MIGISPSGAVIFVSDLYPGSISDKELTRVLARKKGSVPFKKSLTRTLELTRQCGLLDKLESGDSVMADKGFDIEDDLILLGIKLNILPFLRVLMSSLKQGVLRL